jgi:hypothetical protein
MLPYHQPQVGLFVVADPVMVYFCTTLAMVTNTAAKPE